MKVKPIHAFFIGIIGLGFGLMVDNMIATRHSNSDKSQPKTEIIENQSSTEIRTAPTQETTKKGENKEDLGIISINTGQESKTGEILSRIGQIG